MKVTEGKSFSLLVVRYFETPEIGRENNSNVPEILQYQQIVVSGNDTVANTRNSRSQYPIVVGIAANGSIQSRWIDKLHATLKQQASVAGTCRRRFKLIEQLVLEFGQQAIATDQLMFTFAILDQFVTEAPRHIGSDQDVGVEDEPHETSRNTSSSV